MGVRAGRAKPGARCAEVSGVSWPSLHRQESPESHESRVRVLALPRSGCTSLGRSLLISGLQSPYPLWGTLIPPSMGDVLSLFFFSFWPLCAACGILVLRSGIEPESVALKVPRPNPWPAGDFPRTFCVGAPTVPAPPWSAQGPRGPLWGWPLRMQGVGTRQERPGPPLPTWGSFYP